MATTSPKTTDEQTPRAETTKGTTTDLASLRPQNAPKTKSSYTVLALQGESETEGSWTVVGKETDTNSRDAKRRAAEAILGRPEDDPLRQLLVSGKLWLATVPSQSWQPTRVRYERPEPTLRLDT